MVDKDTVVEKITALKRHVMRLRWIVKHPKGVFLGSVDLQEVASFNLMIAVQLCIDIGNHIYAELDVGTPSTYSEIFYELAERKIISRLMLERLIRMIGLRNRIAHDYEDVSQEKIYSILKGHLKDFDLFIRQIVRYAKI